MEKIEQSIIDKLFNIIFLSERDRKEKDKLIKIFYNKCFNDIIFVSSINNSECVQWYKRDYNSIIGYSKHIDYSSFLKDYLFKNTTYSLNNYIYLNIIISEEHDDILIKRTYRDQKILDIVHCEDGFKTYELDLSNSSTSFLLGEVGLFVNYNENKLLILSDPIGGKENEFINVGVILIFSYDSENESYGLSELNPLKGIVKNNLYFGYNLSIVDDKLLITDSTEEDKYISLDAIVKTILTTE